MNGKLVRLKQHDKYMYMLIADPRELIEYINVPEAGIMPERQRPWDTKRVKEISEYVARKLQKILGKRKSAIGLLPSSPVLILTKKELLKSNNNDDFYLDFPTNKDIKIFNILDGQHRLFSFMPQYIDPDFKKDIVYQMAFMIFCDLTHDEELELFTTINNTQRRVESNILRYFQRLLGLISEQDDAIDNLISQLGLENISVLKGRIITSGEKVKKGIKSIQLAKILDESKTYEKLSSYTSTSEKELKILCDYLNAWNNIYKNALKDTKHVFSKISGLRYILFFFPTFVEICKEKRVKTTLEEMEKIVKVHKEITDGDELFSGENALIFSAETSTKAYAKKNALNLINTLVNTKDTFNPME